MRCLITEWSRRSCWSCTKEGSQRLEVEEEGCRRANQSTSASRDQVSVMHVHRKKGGLKVLRSPIEHLKLHAVIAIGVGHPNKFAPPASKNNSTTSAPETPQSRALSTFQQSAFQSRGMRVRKFPGGFSCTEHWLRSVPRFEGSGHFSCDGMEQIVPRHHTDRRGQPQVNTRGFGFQQISVLNLERLFPTSGPDRLKSNLKLVFSDPGPASVPRLSGMKALANKRLSPTLAKPTLSAL